MRSLRLARLIPVLVALPFLGVVAQGDIPIRQEGFIQPDLLLQWVQGQGISTKSDFVTLLPDYLLERPLFMKNSGSRHHGDFEHPRTLLFDEDATFTLAYSGHPKDSLLDTVEMLSTLPKTTSWDLATMSFKYGIPKAIDHDTSACIACHGDPLRPIYAGYPEWLQAYGQCTDDMVRSTNRECHPAENEKSSFDSFLAKATDVNPEYSLLRFKPTSSGYEFWSSYPFPNTTYTARLGIRQALHVFGMMKASDNYSRLKYAVPLFSTSVGCRLPLPRMTAVTAALEREYLRLAKEKDFQPTFARDGFPWLFFSQKRSDVRVLELLGINPLRDLALQYSGEGLTNRPGIPTTENAVVEWNAGTDSLLELVDFLSLVDLMADDTVVSGTFAQKKKRIDEILDTSFRGSPEKLRQLSENDGKIDEKTGRFSYAGRSYYNSLFPQVMDTVFSPTLESRFSPKFSQYTYQGPESGQGFGQAYCEYLAASFLAALKAQPRKP